MVNVTWLYDRSPSLVLVSSVFKERETRRVSVSVGVGMAEMLHPGVKVGKILPALFVISIPAAPPSNILLFFNTGKLAVLIRTPDGKGNK